MSKESYKKTAEYINGNAKLKKFVVFLEKYSPHAIEVIFYSLTAILALKRDKRVFAVGAVPWLVFMAATVISRGLNFKRPFEELGFKSVVPHSKGHSCPSRHATSSWVITMAAAYISPLLGAVSAFFASVVCVTRVITGVHYIRDVVCGILFGGGIGYLMFFMVL